MVNKYTPTPTHMDEFGNVYKQCRGYNLFYSYDNNGCIVDNLVLISDPVTKLIKYEEK